MHRRSFCGHDCKLSPVLEQSPANKGYGNSTTTPYDVTDVETAANLTWEIYQTACELFLELWNHDPIKHLGIHTSRVQSDGCTIHSMDGYVWRRGQRTVNPSQRNTEGSNPSPNVWEPLDSCETTSL